MDTSQKAYFFQVEQARNLTKRENMPLSINHYLKNLPLLTNQWNAYNYREPNRQRIYLKDIDCPQVWHDKLKEKIPPAVFYLNESTGELGGPGANDEFIAHGLGAHKGRGIARAGDLMSSLPPSMRAENLMCYIGHEGTYTPAHREMCASLGQNIMVETSGTGIEDGQAVRPGSSIWFMTETKDRHLVSEYWLSTLSHDIEVESHFAQINAWKAAPFTTYIAEQKVGDFLLIPPLAPHQVWNRGTRTMKVAWNRTTVETLELALDEALPRARMVCRDEQYKNKAIILFSLQKYSELLRQLDSQKAVTTDPKRLARLVNSRKIRQLQKDFQRLFSLYTRILLSEMFSTTGPPEKKIQYLPFDSNVTCSYCRCNIFNRFLTCTSCIIPLGNGQEDTYDICMDCFVMGRSCRCISKYKWVEQFPWHDLVEKHDLWRSQIAEFDIVVRDKVPAPLRDERNKLDVKTLAEICQEQLKARPWRDPKKEHTPETEEFEGLGEEDETNQDGLPKKRRKKRRSEKWLKENIACHICKKMTPHWKHGICKCGYAYCYGSLWRGFDMMPHSVMEKRDWKCPRCLKICSCSSCLKDPEMKAFEPNGTILGHDTRKFADPRSVESLVDFSHSNMHWVKKAGDDHPHETRRLRRRQDEAASAKSMEPILDENYVEEDHAAIPIPALNQDMPIDPLLSMGTPVSGLQKPSNRSNGVKRAKIHDSKPRNQAPDITSSDLALAHEQLQGSKPIRKAAADALSAMSRLEQDPEAFISEAGLDRDQSMGHEEPNTYSAAGTSMETSGNLHYENRQPGIDDGSYQYPDPTIPLMGMSTQTPQLSQTRLDPGNENTIQVNQKHKRMSNRPLVHSDMPLSPHSNMAQQKSTNRQSITTGSRPDSVFAVGTTLRRSLVVKLKIPTSRISRNIDVPESNDSFASQTLDSNGAMESVVLIESDMPDIAANGGPSTARSERPKRKRPKIDNDGEFSLRKPHRRASEMSTAFRHAPTRISPLISESASDIEDEEIPGIAAPTLAGSRTVTRRSLPGYLARRSPVAVSEIPKELSGKRKTRTSHGSQSDHPQTQTSPMDEMPDLSRATPDTPASDNVGEKTIASTEPTSTGSVEAADDTMNAHIANTLTANRKAKLMALGERALEFNDYSSDSDSGLSKIELISPKIPRRVSGSPRKSSLKPMRGKSVRKGDLKESSRAPGSSVRESIFSRAKSGRIRITAAKSARIG